MDEDEKPSVLEATRAENLSGLGRRFGKKMKDVSHMLAGHEKLRRFFMEHPKIIHKRIAPSALFTAGFLLCIVLFPSSAFAALSQGSLVKLACPAGAGVSHPCTAVYFYGHDGKRHAFPNERIYFTWYGDFSGVQTISAGDMASLALGSNVVYRPGSKLVKFLTDPKTYAVGLGGELRWVTSESVASSLYGPAWNLAVDDISDAFYPDYRFGARIDTPGEFLPDDERDAVADIDDNLPATHRRTTVTTPSGTFTVDIVKLHAARHRMRTEAAATSDCADDCPAMPLSAFADDVGASIGIHGTYFCPSDYPDCAQKTGSFLWPFFDTSLGVMLNASSLPVHEGPMLATGVDGRYRFYHRTNDLGSVAEFESENSTALDAAVANYPSLIEHGAIVVHAEPKLDDGMKTIKGTRGGIGMDGRFIWLVVARSATVLDLTEIFVALGAENAMNLDGGGSAAILFGGKYVVGPGRELPNAILFVPR